MPPAFRQAARRAAAGFTLPEVLATMVLIGIVLPVVMQGVSTAVTAAGRARNLAQAAQLGEDKLQELALLQRSGRTGESGDFSPDWPQYRWQCQTQYLDFNAYELQVVVTWIERGAEESLRLSTVVFDTSSVATETETGTGNTSGTSR